MLKGKIGLKLEMAITFDLDVRSGPVSTQNDHLDEIFLKMVESRINPKNDKINSPDRSQKS